MAIFCSPWKTQFMCPKLQENHAIQNPFSSRTSICTTWNFEISRSLVSVPAKFIYAVNQDSASSSSSSISGELDKRPPPAVIIFIKGLAESTSEKGLKMVFSEFGEISRVKFIHDEKTKGHLGYAYMWFSKAEDAQTAVEEMNGKFLDGKFINVSIAKPGSCKPRPKPTPYKF